MPFGRQGIEKSIRAAAGVSPSDVLYLGLLVSTGNPNTLADEASASGYARTPITFTIGSAPTYVATQSANIEFDFTATSDNIRGWFVSVTSSDNSNSDFQGNIVAYNDSYNLDSIGDGTTVTASNIQLRVSPTG